MRAIVVHTLAREYRLACADESIANELGFMAIDPEIAGVELRPVAVAVTSDQGFLRMELPGDVPVEGTSVHLLAVLHRAIRNDVLQSEPSSPLVHGATLVHASRPDSRILIVGRKESGKTTLMLKLIAEGFTVEGDEHLIVRANEVIARPRTLRVKSGSLALVPEFASVIRSMPSVPAWEGHRIYSVPPRIGGMPWIIRPGAVEHIVFLDSNFGGLSMLKPLATGEAFRRLVADTLLPDAAVGPAMARLRRLTVAARTWRLSLGDLKSAVRHLQHGVMSS